MKRLFDIVFSALGLVVTSPLLLLGRLAQAFDFVLVDAPAGGVTPALAAQADGALLVVPARSAASDATRGVIEDFRRAGARVLGVVMNRAGTRRRP